MPYSLSLCLILCVYQLTFWRLWLAVFSLLPVSVPSHPHHVSLQEHCIYIMRLHSTSTAVHFICRWGSHVGPSDTHSHSLYLTFLLCAPSGPLPLDFFLLYITTSGGMFFMANSRLKAVYPESLRSYLTANLPSLKASEKIHSLFSPLLVVGFQMH